MNTDTYSPMSNSSFASTEVLAAAEGVGEEVGPRSGFYVTLGNSINMLLGVGVLSIPYAFAKGGWFVAPLIVLLALTCTYTAYLLGSIQKDLVRVVAPRTMPPIASGYYLRTRGFESGDVMRFEKRVQLQPLPGVQSAEGLKSGLHKGTGTFTVTWLGKSDPRWAIEYEGPEIPDLTVDNENPGLQDNETPRSDESKALLSKEHEFCSAPEVIRLSQYPDIGGGAFGEWGLGFVHFIFTVELFLFLVCLTILVIQNMKHLTSYFTNLELFGMYTVILIPTSMIRDFSRLSFVSYMGLTAAVAILATQWYFAFHTSPNLPKNSGSIISYSTDTDLFKHDYFPYAFSLVMGSFAGHSLFPAFRSSMAHPNRGYTAVVVLSFLFCAFYCLIVGTLGYLQYGSNVIKDCLTLNFDKNSTVTHLCTIAVIIVSYSKHGLANNVLCLFLERTVVNVSRRRIPDNWILYIPVRITVTIVALLVSYLVPNFGDVMALLGAAVSCVISLIFPIASYLCVMHSHMSYFAIGFNLFLLIISCYFAIAGTLNVAGITF